MAHNIYMENNTNETLNCSIAVALAVIGDIWSTKILRDFAIFGGTRRFEQLREALGISRNVLTERLRTLHEQGIVKKCPIEEGARRMEYKLTRKGWELLPMLLATHQWCEKWREDPSNSALQFIDLENGEEIAPIGIYSTTGKLLGPPDLRVRPRTEKAAKYLEDYKTDKKHKPK